MFTLGHSFWITLWIILAWPCNCQAVVVNVTLPAQHATTHSPARSRPLHHPESALSRRVAAADYAHAETVTTTAANVDVVAATQVTATDTAEAVSANTDAAADTHVANRPMPHSPPSPPSPSPPPPPPPLPSPRRPPTEETGAAISPGETHPLWLLIGIGTVPRSGDGQKYVLGAACHLPPPAASCRHLPPPAASCRHLPPPAATCRHLPPPAATCRHRCTAS